ncbi:hypothetical protein K3G39_10925 [Pontibacter sp. HSC-14F20]|uniref:hypothetical protein n=1 Tax=Pontibacter sp. HSC-14F20 TaxID=2864136 RepID=UPI001C73B961|nr:hypothetical protein [Pontibacter sp. HSC-14F20]MBX0333749.1 hypothetical protein [Pontibacter sp. HSC-14F20]
MKGFHQLRYYGSSRVLPYTYFIGLAAFWFFGDLFAKQNISFVAFGIMAALTIQALWQNEVAGTCLGLFASAVSFMVFLATLSEFSDFEVVNGSAIQLIAVGSILSLVGLAMGLVLTITNMRKRAI